MQLSVPMQLPHGSIMLLERRRFVLRQLLFLRFLQGSQLEMLLKDPDRIDPTQPLVL